MSNDNILTLINKDIENMALIQLGLAGKLLII